MQKYFDTVISDKGRPVVGASIVVKKSDGSGATIYSDNGVTVLESLATDANGAFAFYAADGRYNVQVWVSGVKVRQLDDVLLEDQADGFAALSAAGGAALVGFQPSGTGAVQRTAQDKMREVVTPQDFMTDEQIMDVYLRLGTVDITDAFQKALDYLDSIGGGELFLPPGRYRKADTAGSSLLMRSNVTIRGAGDASVIFWDDKDTVPRSGNDMMVSTNLTNIAFESFKIEGTAHTYTNETNQKQTMSGSNIDGLRMTNVTIEKVRYMATSFSYVKHATVSGCRLRYVVRDGLRFTNSYNVVIDGNAMFAVADDAVALHSLDAATLVGSGFVVSNNVFEQCQGIRVLGAKALTVEGNVFRRSLRSPIYVSSAAASTEGNSPQFAINIRGNTILDTFGSLGSNYAIYVAGTARSNGGLANQPGVNAAPYAYNYLNDLDSGTPVKIGAWSVCIENNIIARTLGDAAAYSVYGYGQLFDRVTTGFWSDPAMNDASFALHGMSITGPVQGLLIDGNQLSGLGDGYSGILLGVNGTANLLDFTNTKITRNVFVDIPGVGIYCNAIGSGAGAKLIEVTGNIFDLDPYFRDATHNADNTWSATTGVIAISLASTNGWVVGGNTFKNCGQTGITGAVVADLYPNVVYADFVGSGNNASNKGVRHLPSGRANVVVPIDGDPTSATYGQIANTVVTRASAMPSSGRYLFGHYVTNDAPAVAGVAGSRYTIAGWWRATNGSAHVAGTDWIEQRMLTGT